MNIATDNTVSEHHINFLSSLVSLTHALGPVISAIIPGAAPVVMGAEALESVAQNVIDSVDSVKTAAQNLQQAINAPASSDNETEQAPEVVATINSIPVEERSTFDPAAMAAKAIAKSSDPATFPDRIAKIESDIENLIADISPLIQMFKDDWSKIQSVFKNMGL